MLFVFAGLMAGLTHVFCGPDHLTAVAPFAIREKRKAWLTGLRWGLGHAAGVLVVGVLLLFLRDQLPLESISSWSERLIGIVLIAIGFSALRKAFSKNLHSHEHRHEQEAHVHFHFHADDRVHSVKHSHFHSHPVFGIGALHGLAGSSHFFGILPILAVANKTGAILYMLSFGLGTALAMTFFSSVVSLITHRFTFEQTKAYRVILAGTGLAACIVGSYWLADLAGKLF
jgi:sulfite exporter TauE/SafE